MNNIYWFWWQGIEKAPDIIKICYKSLLKNYNPRLQKINLIDSNNFKEYVDIPNYILDKFNNGNISITHLSDLIRFMILYKYGGLWVDATMFFTKPIDNKIFERDFFTMKNPSSRENDITSKWECFLIGGKKSYELFKILADFWLSYWKNEDLLITYLLTENIFYIAYKENKKIRNDFNKAESFHYPIDYFQKLLNKKFDKKILEDICNKESFVKLSYKFQLNSHIDNSLTFYGKLKEQFDE